MERNIEEAISVMSDRDLLIYLVENQIDIQKKLNWLIKNVDWLNRKDYDHNKHTDWFEELIDKYAKS